MIRPAGFFEHLHQLVSLVRFDFRSDYYADHAVLMLPPKKLSGFGCDPEFIVQKFKPFKAGAAIASEIFANSGFMSSPHASFQTNGSQRPEDLYYR